VSAFVARNSARIFLGTKQITPSAHAYGVQILRRVHEKNGCRVARQRFQTVVN